MSEKICLFFRKCLSNINWWALSIFCVPVFWVLPKVAPPILDFFGYEVKQIDNVYDAITALFAGFAFIGLFYTIKQQKELLKQQDTMLSLQEKQVKIAEASSKEQTKTMELQRFETTFFNLLDSFLSNRGNIITELETGSNALDNLYLEAKRYMHRIWTESEPRMKSQGMYAFRSVVNTFFSIEKRNQLYIYIKNIEGIFALISNLRKNVSGDFDENQKIYLDIFYNHLSVSDINLIYLYATHQGDGGFLKSILVRYRVAENGISFRINEDYPEDQVRDFIISFINS